jgi:hypothetical protein
MTDPMQARAAKRANRFVEKVARQYGGDSPETVMARRVMDNVLDLNSQSGSDLSFLDEDTATRVTTMETAQRAAETYAEKYCTVGHPGLRAMHLTISASKEAQKLAVDALHACAEWFSHRSDGGGPLGDTHHPDDLDPTTAPVAYATSRLGERWIIGNTITFDDVARLLKTDARCDLSLPPFSTNLERFRMNPGKDCLAELVWLSDCYQRSLEMKATPTFNIGHLFPVAFDNQIVFLKLCSDHLYSFYRKYEIDQNECRIEEQWEQRGNYW